jgi:protein-disulfide isomerase
LAGISVSLLAALYSLGLLVAGGTVMWTRSASQRKSLTTAMFAVSCLGAIFSVYLAIVAVVVLHAICILCGGLYVIAVGMLVASYLLWNTEKRAGRKGAKAKAEGERWVWVASAIALAVLAVVVGWEAIGTSPVLSAAEIQKQRPDYYQYFLALPLAEIAAEGGHVRGDANARVTIVEFSDFGCSHCAAFDRRIGDLLRRDADIRLIFRYFPLDSKCNPAIEGPPSDRCMAAAAAECASEQGRFWQYARSLFEHQPNFSAVELRDYAEQLDLDIERFSSCLLREDVQARVAADAKLGASVGVHSTPTLFLNGRRIEGDPGANLIDAIALARETHSR